MLRQNIARACPGKENKTKRLHSRSTLGKVFLLFGLLAALSMRARAVEATPCRRCPRELRPAHRQQWSQLSNINAGAGYTGLLQFDLGVLPSGTTSAQIAHATLRLYTNRVDTAGLVSLQPLNGAWSEYGITYQTLPATGSVAQVFSVSQAGQYVAIDVTALVQGWITAPATNFGLALTAGDSLRAVRQQGKRPDRARGGCCGHPNRLARSRWTTRSYGTGRSRRVCWTTRTGWRSGGCRSDRSGGSHRPGRSHRPPGAARDQGSTRPRISGHLQLHHQLRPQRCRRLRRLKLYLHHGVQPRQQPWSSNRRLDFARLSWRHWPRGSGRYPGNGRSGRHPGSRRHPRRSWARRPGWSAGPSRPRLPGRLPIRAQLHPGGCRPVAGIELGLARRRQSRQHARPKSELLGHSDPAGAARRDRSHRSARPARHPPEALGTGRTTRRARRPGLTRHTRGRPARKGISGTTGATGLSGPMGPQGPAGPVGLSFRGAYQSSANYGLGPMACNITAPATSR